VFITCQISKTIRKVAVFPNVLHSEVKRGPLLHTVEAGYLSQQQRGILGGGNPVWMPIYKLTEKSLCPVVNRIWVRVDTVVVNVEYLQLTLNVESIPHRQAGDKCSLSLSLLFFYFIISLARLVPGHFDRMLLL